MTRLVYDVKLPASLKTRGRTTKLRALIMEFIESGADVAKVAYGADDYVSAKSCCGAISVALRKMHIKTVRCACTKDECFLIRLEPEKDELNPSKNGGFVFN